MAASKPGRTAHHHIGMTLVSRAPRLERRSEVSTRPIRAVAGEGEMTRDELLSELKRLANDYFSNMEGTTLEEFEYWEKMYLAASFLAEEIEKEGKR